LSKRERKKEKEKKTQINHQDIPGGHHVLQVDDLDEWGDLSAAQDLSASHGLSDLEERKKEK